MTAIRVGFVGLGNLLSRRRAARKLSIGYATLRQILDAQAQSTLNNSDAHCNALAEVLD